MVPLLSNDEINVFKKYLNHSQVYFEYGSGGSTYQAAKNPNIKKIYSVESDKQWHNTLKNKIKIENKHKINFIFVDMKTKPNTWGNPGAGSTINDWIKYSRQILYLPKEEVKKIDMIFIDGRFRVACCLNCYNVIRDDCKILFDDFLNREYYHIILNFFEIIEKTDDNKMVVLKKILNINPPSKELIHKYENIKQ